MLTKLEPCYLMVVLKYLDSVDTLCRFNLVSHNCQTAISATRINPCCGINSIGLAITLGIGRMQRIESKVFDQLDTYQVHFRELEKMNEADLEKYKMFNIYKFMMKDNLEDCKVALSIRDRISTIGIDTNYSVVFKLETMPMLRELNVRIGDNPKYLVLEDVFAAIKNNKSLQKLTISFKSNITQRIINEVLPQQNRINISFIISWLDDNDVTEVVELINKSYNPIGISDINLNAFHSFFMNKNKVVLIPLVKKYFRVSKTMKLDPRYNELKNFYLPVREEEI
ncbi:hypothetical protein EDI_012760 [Entamoeba dispar SAW760]|uniref:F-box domain-containing protein n=1 Tax=Entamoeba dispar (strain ATCC PRA-260 / SAW760) TaxID=370354 RepID=B0E7Z4_ENTDS|nr:uncharacterized protein EDI_012760 [Entamoeba dispar SAW760]EDR29384.1 hypothetical protein EDI_012760 [Entamoeba dispar SAW760]|eukprot:EDR29384.1 hypothetical protein EDI_012760 [Entamoeba dispar SAW760]